MTIEELFGTLQMSVVAGWRKHLRTAKYSKHKALDEFYTEMPDKVDALIEGWMGAHGKKIGSFQNILSSSNMNTLKYLGELKKVCKDGYKLMGDNDELKSLLDDIINLINSTLYKVKELSESEIIDLKDYINEALNEANNTDIDDSLKTIKEIANKDVYMVSQCYDWLEKSGWKHVNDEDELFDLIKNLDKKGLDKRTLDLIKELNKQGFDKRKFDSNYLRCVNAMTTAGKRNAVKFILNNGW